MPIEGGIAIPETEILKPYGCIVVPTGPSGVGKDTLMNQLLLDPDFQAEQIVTYTSRPMRPYEVNGVDYHFVSKGEFEEMIGQGFFAEHIDYYGDYKGTPKEPFKSVLNGKNVVWRIDPSRAATINKFYDDTFDPAEADVLKSRTLVTYIGVSRLSLILDRVKARSGEQFAAEKETFLKRLRGDWVDWETYGPAFENVLMNDGTIDESVAALKQLIAVKFG